MSKREAPDLTSFDIPRAKKGGAAPAAGAPRIEEAPPPAVLPAVIEGLPPPAAGVPPPPAPLPEPLVEAAAGEPRSAVTTRLTLRTQERLRLLAFKSRRTKQAILDEALEVYLTSKGV